MRKSSSLQTTFGGVHNSAENEKTRPALWSGLLGSMKSHGYPRRQFLSTPPVGAECYRAYLNNTICHSVVTLVTLEPLITQPHVVLVHFAGMENRIASYPSHILVISRPPE